MKIVVVSTTFNPPADARERCLASVREQRRAYEVPAKKVARVMGAELFAFDVEHVYIDAAKQDPPRDHWYNLSRVIERLDPETVVVALDGDDWLASPTALATVAKAHAEGTWVTYGSFRFADGRPGFAGPTQADHVRELPWTTTHLKTFRAGLFQRIQREHLLDATGAPLYHARDMALMFPILEMAGPERSRFIPEVLYVYNYGNSEEHNGTPEFWARDRATVAYVRSLPRYARVGSL